MTTETFTLNTGTLRAIVPFRAVKDVRIALKGVCIEPRPDGSIVLVASTGALCAVIKAGHHELSPEFTEKKRFVLDGDAIATASKQRADQLTVTPTLDGSPWTIGNALVPLVDVHYPEWPRIFPKEIGGITEEPTHFNWDLIKPFLDAAKALGYGKGGIQITQRGPADGAIVTIPRSQGQFVGIWMPYRPEEAAGKLNPSEFDWVGGAA